MNQGRLSVFMNIKVFVQFMNLATFSEEYFKLLVTLDDKRIQAH